MTITPEDLRYCLKLAKMDVLTFNPEFKRFYTTDRETGYPDPGMWECSRYARTVSAYLGIKPTRSHKWSYATVCHHRFSEEVRTPHESQYAKRVSVLLSLTNSLMRIGHPFDE